ncbi:MAG TPA: patatin-like phospholipase family protein [Thermoanaerobaculia bacterium]|nr:patatin-like phospholipase family protein [Thermoanaerobaculia bacterium]
MAQCVSALERIVTALTPKEQTGDLAVMLTGGGARAAYQVGLLLGLARHYPNLKFQIVTGVSAGAINAAFLAAHTGSLAQKARDLEQVWCELEWSSIWSFDWRRALPFHSAFTSIFPKHRWTKPQGAVDTAPLARLLYRVMDARPGQPIRGIAENLERGDLHAVAVNTLDYSTGQSVRWVQGHHDDTFEGPNRRSVATHLTVEHILASCALPFFFPAVQIGSQWHGDGGIRLAAPLSPALHLGARRVIAMSTGYQRTDAEASTPVVRGYPPAAQILGQLMNAIFLDVIDEDVVRMERMNDIITKLDARERDGLKAIDLLVLRPSEDLGKLATAYEKYLPRYMKLFTRALGAKQTESPDFISLLMFEPRYTRELIDIGKADVDSRIDEIHGFLGDAVPQIAAL